jgi:adenine-specific DNA methylase
MKEKTFELGDMVMIRNHLEHNGEVGIIVETSIQKETYYRSQYKVFFKNSVQWFHNFELESVS